jgi:hypothetical protein
VTVITTAFEKSAQARAHILGMEALPIVSMQHPLASKSAVEVKAIAERIVGAIAQGLTGARQ